MGGKHGWLQQGSHYFNILQAFRLYYIVFNYEYFFFFFFFSFSERQGDNLQLWISSNCKLAAYHLMSVAMPIKMYQKRIILHSPISEEFFNFYCPHGIRFLINERETAELNWNRRKNTIKLGQPHRNWDNFVSNTNNFDINDKKSSWATILKRQKKTNISPKYPGPPLPYHPLPWPSLAWNLVKNFSIDSKRVQ